MTVINWELIKHPMNWVIVILMVLFAGVAIHLVVDMYGARAAN